MKNKMDQQLPSPPSHDNHVDNDNGSFSSSAIEEGHPNNVRSNSNGLDRMSFSSKESDSKRIIAAAANNKNSPQQLVQRETLWLSKARMMMLVVLALAAAASAIGTFHFMKYIEDEDFTTRYRDFGNQIIAVSQKNAIHIFQTYESMSLQMTAYTMGTNAQWPFVLYPQFGPMIHQALEQTKANYVGFGPLLQHKDRVEFENFINENQEEWISNSLRQTKNEDMLANITVPPFLFRFDEEFENIYPQDEYEIYAPVIQVAPILDVTHLINYDGFDFPYFKRVFEGMENADRAVLSEVINFEDYEQFQLDIIENSYDEELIRSAERNIWPASFMASPIYDRLDSSEGDRILVGTVTAEMPWHSYFENVIPEGIDGIYIVVKNTCEQEFTYLINGPEVTYLGRGDYHDESYDKHEIESSFTAFISVEDCTYSFHVYPSEELESAYQSNRPIIFTFATVLIFVAVSLVFVIYDSLVERRQEKVMNKAIRTGAIVNSLFPEQVRDRLMDEAVQQQEQEEQANQQLNPKKKTTFISRDSKAVTSVLQAVRAQTTYRNPAEIPLTDPEVTSPSDQAATTGTASSKGKELKSSKIHIYESKPIADLFPDSTVLFGDLVGFTAWSSVREPSQVFILLETLYHAFDQTARKLGVFKVETIGDCYMAATGLPEPRPDHAVVMARFARHCIHLMHTVVNELDRQLGPDTAELAMRFGLHSGPVTAGVLRGEKSRFQLFGDTVNTASRMESTGSPHKIQLSQSTANLIKAAGKSRWIKPREEKVVAKGKGVVQTYWLVFRPPTSSSIGSTDSPNQDVSNQSTEPPQHRDSDMSLSSQQDAILTEEPAIPAIPGPVLINTTKPQRSDVLHRNRLVEWNVDVLETLLKKIMALHSGQHEELNDADWLSKEAGASVWDEVQDVIALPDKPPTYLQDPSTIKLNARATVQLRDYVETISSMYNNNAFHSFGHACHMLQSVLKSLSRITTQDASSSSSSKSNDNSNTVCSTEWHKFTYGIASDPLTQFAIAFSALIHDVDHSGIPNSQLVKEGTDVARLYDNTSVHEQKSVDVAWDLLMEPDYKDLRACIYTTREEHDRFRQLVVNCVISTDILDEKLNAKRRNRWDDAFDGLEADSGAPLTEQQERDQANKKATVVIEHLIQASDVAHTMQHWHIFTKWNERLFHELYRAYLAGRGETDPSVTWYESELKFFDQFVLPLAEQLKECGAFGVAADEYLTYATANRNEFAEKGREMVHGYLSTYNPSSGNNFGDGW